MAVAVAIRFARDEDAPALAGLANALAGSDRMDAAIVRRDLLCADAPFLCMVADAGGGDLAAYVLFGASYDTEFAQRGIYLSDLYVRPEFRGSGIGLQLMRAVARDARRRWRARFMWLVTNQGAAGASPYYARHHSYRESCDAHAFVGEEFQRLADADEN